MKLGKTLHVANRNIDASRLRREIFQTRLRYFLRMTAQNKMFGMVR
jgi:hypothetical protein